MGRSIHRFRLNERNCLTFYMYEDDFCKATDWRPDQFVNAVHNVIRSLTNDKTIVRFTKALYKEVGYFGTIHVRTDLWDLITKIEEDYIAFTIVPDTPTRYEESFRNNLYAKSANAFMRKLINALPVRCYGGQWTRGVLLSEETFNANKGFHYKPI